jgi:hypothetical protein
VPALLLVTDKRGASGAAGLERRCAIFFEWRVAHFIHGC